MSRRVARIRSREVKALAADLQRLDDIIADAAMRAQSAQYKPDPGAYLNYSAAEIAAIEARARLRSRAFKLGLTVARERDRAERRESVSRNTCNS